MENSYQDLHLEEILIPDEYMQSVEEDLWENGENATFYLTIQQTAQGICYECAMLPFEDESSDMNDLNSLLEEKGYEPSGYGWEEYLVAFAQDHYPEFAEGIGTDSESDTCGIYVMDSVEDFRTLLQIISEGIRELASEA